jgi:hypothetical protein
MADLAGKFTNRLEDKPGDFRRKLISALLAPTVAERTALEARHAELSASLIPTPGKTATDVIVLLIAGAPAFGMSEREADMKALLYAEALRKEPTWAIERARQRFATGDWSCPWNGTGCPSSANVVAECRAITLPIEAEIHKIGQILGAEEVDGGTTDEDRQNALDAWAKLKTEIGSSNVLSERTSDEITREREAMARANERLRARDAAHRQAVAAKAVASEQVPS